MQSEKKHIGNCPDALRVKLGAITTRRFLVTLAIILCIVFMVIIAIPGPEFFQENVVGDLVVDGKFIELAKIPMLEHQKPSTIRHISTILNFYIAENRPWIKERISDDDLYEIKEAVERWKIDENSLDQVRRDEVLRAIQNRIDLMNKKNSTK